MHASLAFLVLAVSHADAPNLEVQFRPVANLTYQLDLLTDQMPYDSSANVKKLWADRFLASDEDREMVRVWRERRNELNNRREPGGVSRVFFPIEWMGPRADGESRVRGAGFDAVDLADYGTRIKKESPEAGADLQRVASYFMPRFQQWWKSEAAPSGESYAAEMRQLLAEPKMQKTLSEFISFYKAELGPKPTLPLVLLYRPSTISEPSTGQQLGHYSVVQFLTKEKPSERIDVVLHEFAHFLYGKAAPENLAKLQQRFLSLKRTTAIPAYNLLNEGIATALGNGVVGEQFEDRDKFEAKLKKPRSLYNDPAIDSAGKAVFGWIKPYLAKGGSLHDEGFAKMYVESLERSMPEQLDKPRAYLTRFVAFTDEAITNLKGGQIAQPLRASSYSRYSVPFREPAESAPLKEFENTSVIIVVSPANRGSLARIGFLSKKEQQEIDQARPTVYAARRGPNAIAYVITASTAEEAMTAVDKINALEKFAAGPVP